MIETSTATTAISEHHNHEAHQAHQAADRADVFGFWIYILSDCVLFATLFATYAVLHTNTFGGPSIKELTHLPYVLVETLCLLASSFTYGLAMLGLYQRNKSRVIGWLMITFLLGLTFIAMELNEFIHLYAAGHTWQTSAALSAFFTLVGTHGLHVTIGLIWMVIMMFQVKKMDINAMTTKRLTYLGLFWHFLDIVWIFVFTIVYLMGAL